MPLSDHVSILITRDTVGVARAGFGVPLILSHNAAWTDRVRYYTDLPGLVSDGFAVDSPEYRAASAMLMQSPRPRRIAVGRGALKPTQRYELTLPPSGVKSSHAYLVTVDGEDMSETDASFTSDASATSAEVAVGLAAAINGVAGNGYTAATTGGDFPIIVTADSPGYWFSIEVDDLNDLEVKQTHADPGVATDLNAIVLEQPDWYALLTLYNSEAYVLAAAAWVEANKRIYAVDVNESESVTTTVGNGDTLDELHTDAYSRVLGSYHPSPAAFMSAALYGKVLPIDPGGESWKFKNLAGVPTVQLTATHVANLRARNANTYESMAGRGMTWDGKTSDGEFLDTIRGLDWLEDDMVKGVYEVLSGANKVPFTDGGIAMIEAPMRATLRRAVRMGILAAGTPGDATDPEPLVTVPRARDVSSGNRALRVLPDMKFSGRLAGAVHSVDIVGTVSV